MKQAEVDKQAAQSELQKLKDCMKEQLELNNKSGEGAIQQFQLHLSELAETLAHEEEKSQALTRDMQQNKVTTELFRNSTPFLW